MGDKQLENLEKWTKDAAKLAVACKNDTVAFKAAMFEWYELSAKLKEYRENDRKE